MEERSYQMGGFDPQVLALRLSKWMIDHDLEIQVITEKGATVVQGRKREAWRIAFGLCYALTVRLEKTEDGFKATVGTGQWADKLAAGTLTGVAIAVRFIPNPVALVTAVPAGYGFLRQMRLIQGAWQVVEDYVNEKDGKTRTVRVPISILCEHCGTPNATDHQFCSGCGRKLDYRKAAAGQCAACHQALPNDAAFCPHCGKPVPQEATVK